MPEASVIKSKREKNMKIRLDQYLTDKGFAETRSKAQALIMCGVVYVNEQKTDKAGTFINQNDSIEVRQSLKYVSRGGLKLEKAMSAFGITLSGKICMDIGASTGGFTDCMLQNGAAHVFSVDVGYGQLAWSLRTDPRVTNMERTNIRFVTAESTDNVYLDFASVDVSFISLKLIFPVLQILLKENGEFVCLIKPQFEAGREKVGKNGVIREPQTHVEVIESVTKYAKENGFIIKGLDYSPIKGPKGNIEYLLYAAKTGEQAFYDVNETVDFAHQNAK